MVHADAAISGKAVQHLERVTDYGSAEMTDMERLRDVRRRIVEHYRLALAEVERAVICALFGDFGQQPSGEVVGRDVEVDISSGCDRAVDDIVAEIIAELRGNRGRSHFQFTAQFEAGECEVAERLVGRVF